MTQFMENQRVLDLKFKVAPQSHQSFRIGKNGIRYKPKKIKDYQNYLVSLALEQLPDDFRVIEAGTPIRVEYVHYVYAYPKSMSKRRRNEKPSKTTKPDLQGNLNKAFFDALEGIIYEQDQNIVEISSMRKYYGEENGIIVRFVY